MSGSRLASTALAIASLILVACDSSDDDDGMDPPVGPGSGPGAALDVSGDFAMIAARGPADEPYAFDFPALETDLAMRFGSLNDEPLDIDDVEDAVTVANRGR